MAEQSCGASVFACVTRVVLLEGDGVPLNVANNMYVTDALVKMEGTPQFTKIPEVEILNACGALCVTYKTVDPFKRVDLTLEICTLDPELEQMLVGGELFTSGGFSVGGSAPPVGTVEANVLNGVSVELWSKHIVNGDIDPIWPYIHWIWPRTHWQPDKQTFDINHMPRLFTGFTSQNPNFEDGPTGDWAFASDRTYAWAFTKTLPAVSCGAQSLAPS
jgi:hypothetical protein